MSAPALNTMKVMFQRKFCCRAYQQSQSVSRYCTIGQVSYTVPYFKLLNFRMENQSNTRYYPF